jgi:hypothetical protein
VYGIYWRATGLPFFQHPGHWLLLQQALAGTLYAFAAIAAVAVLITGDETGFGMLSLFMGIFFLGMQLCGLFLTVFAAWKIADTWAWRWLFIIDALLVLFPFLGSMVGIFNMDAYYSAMGIACLVTVWAAAGDWWAGRERDWPHWVGVVLNIGGYVAMFLTWLASLLIISEMI